MALARRNSKELTVSELKKILSEKDHKNTVDMLNFLIQRADDILKEENKQLGKKVRIRNLGDFYQCVSFKCSKNEIVEIPEHNAYKLINDFPGKWEIVE